MELSRDYGERARIFTYVGVAQGIGAILFAAAPFLPFFRTTGLGPQAISAIGWTVAISLPSVYAFMLVVVPQGAVLHSERPSLRKLFGALRANRLLWRFLAAYMVGGTAQTIVLACFYFFMDAYLKLGSKFPVALLVVYLGGMAGIPLWLAVIRRFGKHRAWAAGWGSLAVTGIALALLPPGAASLLPLLAIVAVYGAASAIDLVAPLALLGDIVDYDQWKTRVNRAGNYNALAVLLQKGNIALGGAIAFFALDWVGFDVRTTEHSAASSTAFLLIFAALPAVLFFASSWIVWRFPLDRRRHELIRRRLAQRSARLPVP
jgi:glycoside/pentoside/hexuronide:cation symporter, GPH family